MDQLIGRRLDGRYQITDLIGTGGMANVYKAADLLENRTVAVKVLREEFLDNEELVRRFKNESKAIGLLSHPNIVKVFDVNFSNAIQYIVMEFIDGITLKQYIDNAKPLSWKDTVHFSVQILRALQHAHDRGIVHRDIKPQNMMLMANGSIKVMDFGIARLSRSETRTITDKAIGSVHYISPEQAKGDITDSKADIYSVGIMMYEMLTGVLPFESDTPVQVAIKQISDEAQRPREIVESIPEGLEEITLKAMTKDTVRRYQSASQMLRDIDDFKKNPSIVFEYKYISDNMATKYIDKSELSSMTNTNGTREGDSGVLRSSEPKKSTGAAVGKKKKAKKRPKVSTYLITGITAACVVCTLVLTMFMLGVFEGRHEDVELPDFKNQDFEDIRSNPEYKTFKFRLQEEYNQEYEIGIVYDQSPMPGKMVKDNSEVTLYVSKGGEDVTLMDVVGMQSGEAKQALKSQGVRVVQQAESNTAMPANEVLRMSPEANSVVPAGSEVIIYVNMLQGGTTSIVPDMLGERLADALKMLNENNLKKGVITEVADDAPAGTVIEQSMPAGTKVAGNTAIDLTVSKGPATQTYSGIQFQAPSGPDVGGVIQQYEVKITVDGVTHQTVQVTNATAITINTFTVSKNNTKIKVFLVYNSVEYQYLVFNASNTESSCVKESGTETGGAWPFRALMSGGYLPDLCARRRFGLY